MARGLSKYEKGKKAGGAVAPLHEAPAWGAAGPATDGGVARLGLLSRWSAEAARVIRLDWVARVAGSVRPAAGGSAALID